jgi:hypothetical protein
MNNPASYWKNVLKWLGAAFAAAVLLVGTPLAGAGDRKFDAKGEQCVRDTEYMRRNHMDLLKHQRDDTMRRGIRTTQNSLKGCVDCHASPKNNSVIGSKDNFCQGCHTYAAVKLDCFECHSSKPKAAAPQSHGMAPLSGVAGQLQAAVAEPAANSVEGSK